MPIFPMVWRVLFAGVFLNMASFGQGASDGHQALFAFKKMIDFFAQHLKD